MVVAIIAIVATSGAATGLVAAGGTGATGVAAAAAAAAGEAGASGAAATALATAASTGASGAGAAALAPTVAATASPAGWLILGAEEDNFIVTYDCWKPIFRDQSTDASKGMLLQDVLLHEDIAVLYSNVKSVSDFQLLLTNKWGERFLIEPVKLPNDVIAAHATAVI